MNDYVPRIGDRVRATLGENVLVGHWGRGIILNQICLDSGHVISQEWDGWQFEQVVEVPTKIGAIVRLSDGTLWVRRDRETFPWGAIEGLFAEASDSEVLIMGFTVEFEGIG